MGISKEFRDSIIREAEEEAKGVVSEAEAKGNAIMSEERNRSQQKLKAAEEEAKRMMEAQRKERIAWARLESKRIIAEAKEDAINNSLEDFFKMLSVFRNMNGYTAFLNKVVKNAIEEFGEKPENLVVHVVKGDRKVLSSITAKIVEDLDGFGGAIVERKDGSVRVNATLETLFENKREGIRKEVYEKLQKTLS